MFRTLSFALLVTASPLALMSSPALAQEETITRQAADAFGEQMGVDRVGLYNEAQVRGFDLQQSAAYRIDDHYFVRATGLSESIMGGLSVKVGASAAGLSLPSPSGVVVYRLREPGTTNGIKVNAGFRDFATVHTEAETTLVSGDGRLAVVATVIAEPFNNSSSGQSGAVYDAGAVIAWRPDSRSQVRLFGAYQKRDFDGYYIVIPSGDREPPPLPRTTTFAPDWSRAAYRDTNAGVLYDGDFGDWRVGASLTYSAFGGERTDVAVLLTDGDGNAMRTTYYCPPQESHATAAEVKLTRRIVTGAFRHDVGIALRARSSGTDLAQPVGIDGGSFNIRERPADGPAPVLPDTVPTGHDSVEQTMLSLTYNLAWADRLDLRLGAHQSRYDKTTRQPGTVLAQQRSQDNWLYNASAVVRASQRLRLFASYVTGLEESGVAPASAVNRGEVLPPVESKQWEAGASYDLRPGLTLIAAWFDITKPVAGLRSDGRYDLVGDVRHSGYEVSLSGQVTPATNVVLGAVLLRPRLSGQPVASGQSLDIPPGVSYTNTTVNVEHQFNNGWSVDGQLLFEGRRRMTPVSRTEVPGVTFLTLGARYDFRIADRPVTGRFQVVNALDQKGYYATPSSALVPIWSRTWRLAFNTAF
ncbi:MULTISPECIES: TonB-dependent receptor domain-containing protein [Asticcacaulis]|uniref:TonB-dependent receptor domain-containing protein n=1 Tax=Asticcacaulis TaxID=76890 RepID=UPI001AE8D48E|nr:MULTISPECIES: TonB-dependent receptor [Asticcacaulis]MBP2159312.1 iron complex outermembrane receptor protein [Asticcacaulis solisilvae]MDR6800357.1 iron complex outermembrane receptor protein [Asticcacaulis sp. BE141]